MDDIVRAHSTAVIGKNARIASDVIIEPFVFIADNCTIGAGTRVCSHASVFNNVVIEENVLVGNGASIREHAVLSSGAKVGTNSVVLPHAKVGKNVTVHALCLIGEHTVIEEGAWLGPGVHTYNTIHPKAYRCPEKERCDREGAPHIGRNARIGGGSVISPFVHIGEHAVVGAGSVVIHSVNANDVVVGNPERVVGRGSNVECRYDKSPGVYDHTHLKK